MIAIALSFVLGLPLGTAGFARAEVSESEAARLGGDELTPIGAEKQANAAGSIPAWTGGITQPPADFKKGRHETDPFRDDEILYSIDARNLSEHATKLSDGLQALLTTHAETLRLNVYPTRRSASYPQWVYQAVGRNAREAKLVTAGKGSVTDSTVSSAFPIPRTGVEVVWNHLLRFRGLRVSRINGVAAVTRLGLFNVALARQEFLFAYGFPEGSPIRKRFVNILFALRSRVFSPALVSGDGTLGIEPLDQTKAPRRVWSYNRALRRVVREPYFAYEHTSPSSGGLRTVDDGELFNGPPDRFEWTLLGKREMIIPYNAYRLHDDDVSDRDILERRHVASDLMRYELHRVWVVEGKLRKGERHIYSRRVFYVDEDSWQIALADTYDLDGKLWRIGEAHALNYYDVPVHWATLYVYHDLKESRYLVEGLDNGREPFVFSDDADPREFSPIALNFYVR